MEDLKFTVFELQTIQKKNLISLNLKSQAKLEKAYQKTVESIEKELASILRRIDDQNKRISKLVVFTRQFQSRLMEEREEYEDLISTFDGSVEDILNLEVEGNAHQYYRLTDKKRAVQEQVKSVEVVSDKYRDAMVREHLHLLTQNNLLREKLDEQKQMIMVQQAKLKEAVTATHSLLLNTDLPKSTADNPTSSSLVRSRPSLQLHQEPSPHSVNSRKDFMTGSIPTKISTGQMTGFLKNST